MKKNFCLSSTCSKYPFFAHELAFYLFLKEKGFKFEMHPTQHLSYQMNGKVKSYFPDVWVSDWQSFVEIKSNYTLEKSVEKLKLIQLANPSIKLKILTDNDLRNLGIDMSNRRLKHLGSQFSSSMKSHY